MGECKLCGRNEEGLSVLSAHHKDLGNIWVCQECWGKLWNKNSMVCGTSSSGSTCPTCR